VREVATLAQVLGPVPWSVFFASSNRIREDPEPYLRFRRAIETALVWIRNHPSEEVARLIEPWFRSVRPTVATAIIERYRKLDGWPARPMLLKADVDRWQGALVRWGMMPAPVPLHGLLSFVHTPDAAGDTTT